MKRGLDNNKLNNKNINTEGQRILIQRLMEILDNKTIDTYKNRLNNVHGSLRELISVCYNVKNGIILDYHIEPVKNECQIKVGQETVLRKYNKEIYNILNARIKSKKGTLLNFISEIEVILNILEQNYLGWILKELKNDIDENKIEDVNKQTENLVTELILRGWTKYSIHKIIDKVFIGSNKEFDIKWVEFLYELSEEQKEFNFFINLDSELDLYLGNELMDKEQILSNYPSINSSYIDDYRKYIYLKTKTFENDLNKAVNNILNELNAMEAEHIYCGKLIKARKNSAIVLLPDGRSIKYNLDKYNIRTSHESQKQDDFKYSEFENIRKNPDITIDTRNRINNVLMQYRLGYNTDSVETWFISFWFALESLVVTDQYENIIEHIVEIVTPITTLKYTDKILKNLIEDFNRAGISLASYDINSTNDESILKLLDILKDSEKSKELIESINNYDLLVVRVQQIKGIFKNSKTLSTYLETHHRNIEYHLRRLYRIRNSFVHNATVEYDLYPLTMHLHSYLRDIIEEVVKGLNCGCYNNINNIYACCKLRYESTIANLKSNGNDLYKNELIISNYCENKKI